MGQTSRPPAALLAKFSGICTGEVGRLGGLIKRPIGPTANGRRVRVKIPGERA